MFLVNYLFDWVEARATRNYTVKKLEQDGYWFYHGIYFPPYVSNVCSKDKVNRYSKFGIFTLVLPPHDNEEWTVKEYRELAAKEFMPGVWICDEAKAAENRIITPDFV